jgi:hypothetical protein
MLLLKAGGRGQKEERLGRKLSMLLSYFIP